MGRPGPPYFADFGNVYGCDGSSSKAKYGCRELKVAMRSSICAASSAHCSNVAAFRGGGAALGFGTAPNMTDGGGYEGGFGTSHGPWEYAMALHKEERAEVAVVRGRATASNLKM